MVLQKISLNKSDEDQVSITLSRSFWNQILAMLSGVAFWGLTCQGENDQCVRDNAKKLGAKLMEAFKNAK
jgi:hypothetical protein